MNNLFRPSDFGQEVQAGDALTNRLIVVALIFAVIVMVAI